MILDLRVARQARCAATPEGHRLPGDYGICTRCGLEIQARLRPVK